MQLYPDSAQVQLEFDKVKALLKKKCATRYAMEKTDHLHIFDDIAEIECLLRQTDEYMHLILSHLYFPDNFTPDLSRELRLLSIPGSMLGGNDFLAIRALCESVEGIFRWFSEDRITAYPYLNREMDGRYYDKSIVKSIDEVIDSAGQVVDSASADLSSIRLALFRKRNELRKVFNKAVARMSKAGMTAEIQESFSNGRRVIAVSSEYKRQVKGILHGESDSRKTSFIEPEETIELNNEVYSLENEEQAEVQRILRALSARLSSHAGLLSSYLELIGIYDFIHAKASLALDMNACLPNLSGKAELKLVDAFHPLLYLYNKASGKKTYPISLDLDEEHRILIISGPNAGGKTVTMKTIALNQVMLQSGMLITVSPVSTVGIFRQLFIHIGDTQSIEFELSTYSSHLMHMKFFVENAGGKTLFFVDELGSGSDPNLGGAFAEAILESMRRSHARGIVTTHYLNLKVMGSKGKGVFNGAMAFDESQLLPLYRLLIGKPGSSYTFSIAERIGLPTPLIDRARTLADRQQYRLDKLLNSTEQNMQKAFEEHRVLQLKIRENEKLREKMQQVMDREQHVREVELLKLRNKETEEKIKNLRDLERKMKQIVLDWKKSSDKKAVIHRMEQLLFHKKENLVVNKLSRKIDSSYQEISEVIQIGTMVKMKKNFQVGSVIEIRGKRAVVQIGQLPMSVDLKDLIAVSKIKQENT